LFELLIGRADGEECDGTLVAQGRGDAIAHYQQTLGLAGDEGAREFDVLLEIDRVDGLLVGVGDERERAAGHLRECHGGALAGVGIERLDRDALDRRPRGDDRRVHRGDRG
jgi:hypothetical protein